MNTDDVWLEAVFDFIRKVGDKGYAVILVNDALSCFGYGPADVPDEGEVPTIMGIAEDLFESGKQIRREALRPLEGPRAPTVWKG